MLLPTRAYPGFLLMQEAMTAALVAGALTVLCVALVRGWRPKRPTVMVIAFTVALLCSTASSAAVFSCDWFWWTIECWLLP